MRYLKTIFNQKHTYTGYGWSDSSAGFQIFKYKQSSLWLGTAPVELPGCIGTLPYFVQSLIPSQGAGATGGANLKSPVAGAAKGMPLKLRVVPFKEPFTSPYAIHPIIS
jgi:hypothetical protein